MKKNQEKVLFRWLFLWYNVTIYRSEAAIASRIQGGITMLSDIEIAQQCELLPIREVAEKAGITEDELEYTKPNCRMI